MASEKDIFIELLRSVFPSSGSLTVVDQAFECALIQTAQSMGLDLSSEQKEKVHQLHVALQQRTGVIIVGRPRIGKSTLWKLLQATHAAMLKSAHLQDRGFQILHFRKPVLWVLNPKAMERAHLVGWMDLHTREWHDGVLAAIARDIVQDTEVDHWVICDGDIDPEWIESLNSVLDDNRHHPCVQSAFDAEFFRLLTLMNGERIQFGEHVHFIFECTHLDHASPATVSRCSTVLLSQACYQPALSQTAGTPSEWNYH